MLTESTEQLRMTMRYSANAERDERKERRLSGQLCTSQKRGHMFGLPHNNVCHRMNNRYCQQPAVLFCWVRVRFPSVGPSLQA